MHLSSLITKAAKQSRIKLKRGYLGWDNLFQFNIDKSSPFGEVGEYTDPYLLPESQRHYTG